MQKHSLFFRIILAGTVILTVISNSFSLSRLIKNSQDTTFPIEFKDQTKETGLYDLLKGVHGHAVAWGDINNDEYPDLFVGTFAVHEDSTYAHRGHPAYPAPNRLFINDNGKRFIEVTPSETEVYGVCSGAAFADFDNDGYLDLVVSHLSVSADERPNNWVDKKTRCQSNKLYKNNGKGKLIDVTEGSGLIFNKNNNPVAARNTFVLDYNGDGLLDILIQDDDGWPWSVGKSRLMRNKGNMQFEDVTQKAGFPEHFYGLGGVVGDINGDTWPDVFFAHSSEMYINNKNGTFRKLNQDFVPEVFKATLRERNLMWTCGANIGDINGDGLIDFIMGDHYGKKDVPHKIFVFLNKGNDDNENPIFEDVTDKVGIKTAQTKQPHIEIEDLNNDGKMDILVTSRDAFVYLNIGNDEKGLPQFTGPSRSDAPASGLPYWPAGPTADYNRDGLMDFFGPQWYSYESSVLLKNVTETRNNYITIGLNIVSEKNRNGIGAIVEIYKSGKIGLKNNLIGTKVVCVSNGFCSGSTSDVHFGTLGLKKVDIIVKMPCEGKVYKIRGVSTKQYLMITEKVLQKFY